MTPRASQDTKDMENPAPRILVVDDEEAIREGVRDYLTLEGYRVDSAPDALRALARGVAAYDLILLDIMMDHLDGFQMAGRLKADPQTAHIPIIFLTARDTDDDMVAGLSLGADDYIAKPFRPRELISRIRSVLRRTGRAQSVIELGSVRVDTDRAAATKNGVDLNLSALEYRLLLVFLNHRGMTLSRAKLLEEIWDVAGDFVNDNTLTVYIKRLREKLEDDPQEPQLIRTVRGVCYRLEG